MLIYPLHSSGGSDVLLLVHINFLTVNSTNSFMLLPMVVIIRFSVGLSEKLHLFALVDELDLIPSQRNTT